MDTALTVGELREALEAFDDDEDIRVEGSREELCNVEIHDDRNEPEISAIVIRAGLPADA